MTAIYHLLKNIITDCDRLFQYKTEVNLQKEQKPLHQKKRIATTLKCPYNMALQNNYIIIKEI